MVTKRMIPKWFQEINGFFSRICPSILDQRPSRRRWPIPAPSLAGSPRTQRSPPSTYLRSGRDDGRAGPAAQHDAAGPLGDGWAAPADPSHLWAWRSSLEAFQDGLPAIATDISTANGGMASLAVARGQSPETEAEKEFVTQFGPDLMEAHNWCKQYRSSRKHTDLNKVWSGGGPFSASTTVLTLIYNQIFVFLKKAPF